MSAARRAAGAALALGLVLAAAGCGGSSEGTAAAPAAPGPKRYDAPPAAAAPTQRSTSAAAAAPAIGSALLEYPDDVQMVLLAHRLAGGDPAATIRAWAERSDAVRRANEFQREAALAAETQRLQAILAAVADTGRVRIRTTTQLGEYDAAAGVWYLSAFQPGQVFTFSHQQAQAQLALSNAREAYRWPMAAAEAEALKRRTQYRTIEVEIDAALTGGRMRGNGPQLDARIIEHRLRIHGPQGGEIGHVTLP